MANTIDVRNMSAYNFRSALMWIVVANVLIFVGLRVVAAAGMLSGHEGWVDSLLPLLSVPASLPDLLREPWTLLTYMFSQYDLSHLFFNMMWLAWFGMFMQTVCGSAMLSGVYLAGGLGGAAAFLTWSATSQPAMVSAGLLGASASVMAVAVAITIIEPDRPVWLFWFSLELKWVAAIMIAISLLCFSGYHAGSDAAHLGGALMGVLCGVYYRLRVKKRSAQPLTVPSDSSQRSTEQHTLTDAELLDELLDKIRRSGYDSLTPQERATLFSLSQRIKK